MAKFSDLNVSFRTSPTNNVAVLTDLANIKKSLERLFSTGKGDVPFNRDYGTSLKTLLFENNVDPSDVEMFLYMDISRFEPRVSLNPANIAIEKNGNQYIVSCTFTVPALGKTEGTVNATITSE